uniref:N-acetylgalactosaminide beta-1,3-galactosyltransferase n=1 Tax=Parastrongyloides trichosuri TaxID=131310 RepID=A0A0N4ZWD4_PARTI
MDVTDHIEDLEDDKVPYNPEEAKIKEEQNQEILEDDIFTYLCNCGNLAIVSEIQLERFPLRKDDLSRVFDTSKTNIKPFFSEGKTIYIRRSQDKYELVNLKNCSSCGTTIFYQSIPSLGVTTTLYHAIHNSVHLNKTLTDSENDKTILNKRNIKGGGKGKVVISTMIEKCSANDEPDIINTTDNYNLNAKLIKQELERKNVKYAEKMNKYKKLGEHNLAKKTRGTLYSEVEFDSPDLFNDVKIFCIILTAPKFRESRCEYQKRTWLKRCNRYIFISSINDPTLPSIGYNITESRNALWPKISFGMKYVYRNFGKKYDWFLRVDDDSYVIMENLRNYLTFKNPNKAKVYGFRYKSMWPGYKQGIIHGGAGTVLSKAALGRLVMKGLGSSDKCKAENNNLDDRKLSYCLEDSKVLFSGPRDSKGRVLFYPNPVASFADHHLSNSFIKKNAYYEVKQGIDYISDYPISFHRIYGKEMYTYEYLLYSAKIFNKSKNNILKNFIRNKFVVDF